MIISSRRARMRRPLGAIVAASMVAALVLLTASPALAATTGESTEFPLLGWLSFVAVAGLGLMPIALWVRMRTQLARPETAARGHHPVGGQGDAPHPFA